MMKPGLILLLVICTLSSTFAKSIRVGGSSAISSIKEALKSADATDTIFVDPGTYREGNIIIDKPIVLWGIDYPTLDGELQHEVVSIKSDGVVVHGFHVINSGVSSTIDYAGIKIYDSNFVTISNNKLDNCFFGIYTQFGKNCIISDNELNAHGLEEQQCGNGIHCWKCDSLRIISNQVSGHRDGIYFEFVTNSIIWRNRSIGNMRYGLHFMFSNHDMYVSNVLERNGAGVAVMFSHHVGMYNNYFQENWGDASYGILLKEISDGHIQGNHFASNTTGIFMEGASRIVMNRNTFADNGWALKIQASCMDIILEYNDFISNTFDVGTNGSLSLNTFSMNYWDKYAGYDLNKDHVGDVPHRPVSLFSMIVEKNPPTMMLFRSFITTLLDQTERVLPSLIPENLVDNNPRLHRNCI